MPISIDLDVSIAADRHKQLIARSRQSVEGIYRYGNSRIAGWLSILEMDSTRDMPKTSANISDVLLITRARLSAILPGRPHIAELPDILGYTTTRDRVIMSYEILYATVVNLLVGHRGASHPDTCPICISLYECAGVDQAVRDSLPAVRRADQAKQALLRGAPISHRCHITRMRIPWGQVWRVTCLYCGVVSLRPIGDAGLVADLARKHARTAGHASHNLTAQG